MYESDTEVLSLDAAGAPGEREGAAERFDPATMRGQLVEAEHLARYRLAASFATGLNVLDAGCGWGYGSEMIAGAGAASVTGIDISPTVIDSWQGSDDSAVELRLGDVTELPFEDASFEMVVCFEVIEHIERREAALDEFARVLTEDGLLLISSPNREIYGQRNPFHVHEYTPSEFEEVLARRFPHVCLLAQHNWITSMISSTEEMAAEGLDLDEASFHKTVGRNAGEETYLIALASKVAIGKPGASGVMTFDTELLRWTELWEEQDRYLRALGAERDDLARDVDALRTRFEELEQALAAEKGRTRELEFEIHKREVALSQIFRSPSWRATKPLRTLKHAVKRNFSE